jgi:hypothetical protein
MNAYERAQRQKSWSERCARCGYARLNVRHNTTPESQTEGPDYYARMTDLHAFEPTGRYR